MKKLIRTISLTLFVFLINITSISAKPLDGIKFCIDPGHGGVWEKWYDPATGNEVDSSFPGAHRGDAGAVGPVHKLREADETLITANKLNSLLVTLGGATVVMTRTGDYYLGLTTRANIANTNNVDWFVSIHLNSTGDDVTNYTRVLYYPDTTERNIKSKKMAAVMQEHQHQILNIPQSGPSGQNVAVLRETQMPADLSETVFISCKSEENLLNTSDAREQNIAQAIYDGIVDYFTPPIVQKVSIVQDSETKYEAYWQDGTTARTLNKASDKPLNTDATVTVEFNEMVQTVAVKADTSVTLSGSLDSTKKKWTGTLLKSQIQSLGDGQKTLTIFAKDLSSNLLDGNPSTFAKYNPTTKQFDNYEDRYENPTDTHNGGKDFVHRFWITYFKVACTPPSQTIRDGDSRPHYIKIKNLHDSEAADFHVELKDGWPPGWTVSPTSFDENISAGQSKTLTFHVSNNGAVDPISILVEVTAWDNTKTPENLGQPGTPGHVVDHPDDNFSVSSPNYPTPWLYDSKSKIGVLATGWGEGLHYLLGKYKVSTTLVKRDFSILNEPTRSLNDVSVLLVGSAGFEGLDSSPTFRKQLEDYVSQGGVLVVFTTKRGYEWQALPGGQVAGYGWDEDQSCQNRAVYIENYHQMLSGQDSAYLDVNVDGYFTRWSDSATILLRRTKNGMPAMIMYPYGEGLVIASTAYTDWGYGHNQSTKDGRILVRDTVAWAIEPKDLPEFSPGDDVGFSFNVTNNSSTNAAQIKLVTLDPNKNPIEEETITQAVAAGETASVSYLHPAVSGTLGIWYVNYTLLDGDGEPIQDELLGERFVVSDPAEVAVEKEITFGVNSDAEYYAYGSEGVFTVLIWNNSDATQNITCWYSFPHNYWRTGNPIYGSPGTTSPGHRSNQKRTIEVPAKGENSFTITVPLVSYDRLWADFYDASDKYLGNATRGFYTYTPSVTVNIATDKEMYRPGGEVALSLDLRNKQNHDYTAAVNILVLDPDNRKAFEDNIEVNLVANALTHEDVTFTLPETSIVGSYTVRVEAFKDGNKAGSDSTYFQVPEAYIAITPNIPGVLQSGTNTFSFSLEPINLAGIPAGTLEVSIIDPVGTTIWTDSKDFDIIEGQISTINFDAPTDGLLFGKYKLTYKVTYGAKTVTGEKEISCSSLIAVGFDKSSYRIRETMRMDIDITNDGQFLIENATLNVSIPDMGYSYDDTLTLSPNQSTSFSLSTLIPETLSAGTHQGSVTLSLNNSISRTFHFYIPQSQLALSLDETSYHAGDWVRIGIEAVGGVDTTAEYAINLTDRNGVKVFENGGTINLLVSMSRTIDFTVPQNIVTGEYILTVDATDVSTGRVRHLRKVLQISDVIVALEVSTDKQIYHSADAKTAIADIHVSQGAVENGMLKLEAFSAVDKRRTWSTQAEWESGILHSVDTTTMPGDVIVSADATDRVTFELIGLERFGQASEVYTRGHYAYLCAGGALVILDVSTPSAPKRIEQINIVEDDWMYDIDVAGDYAYIGTGSSGLRVVDISDPTRPYEVGANQNLDYIRSLHVVGQYAYVTHRGDPGHVVGVVDISDPTNPLEIATYQRKGWYLDDIYVAKEYAYVADHNSGLFIIDVSEPTNPYEVGFYGSFRGNGVYVTGNYAYVAAGYDGLRVVDISDPTNPHEVGTYEVEVGDFHIVAGYAYALNSNYGLDVVDISDPRTPHKVGGYPTPGAYGAYAVHVAGNYAYVSALGLFVVDISNPGQPSLVGAYTYDLQLHYIQDVDVVGNYAYVAAGGDGLRVVDISNPTHPLEVGVYNVSEKDFVAEVQVVGQYAYLYMAYSEEGMYGFLVIDISDPTHPREVGVYSPHPDPGWTGSLDVAGEYAYLADMYYGLRVVDISDPRYPLEVGFYDSGWEDLYDVAVVGEYVYVTLSDGSLRVLDVSDPTNPYEVKVYQMPDEPYEIQVAGEYAYVNEYWDEHALHMFDISDPINPYEVGTYSDDEIVTYGFRVVGDYLYVPAEYDGLLHILEQKEMGLRLAFDAGNETDWISISWDSEEPEGTRIQVATRTAESQEALVSASWSKYYDASGARVTSSPNRWIQVKVLLETPDPAVLTPVLHELAIDYRTKASVWEAEIPIDVTEMLTVPSALEPIEGTGKFLLQGSLYSEHSQVIATDRAIFYIDDGELHLTFDMDKPVYKPTEAVTIVGEVVNDGSVPATGLRLVFKKGDGAVLYENTIDVPADGIHPYSLNIPPSGESFILDGSLDGITISELIEVEAPRLDVLFDHPLVVGRAPFNFGVMLVNPTKVDVNVNLNIEGDAEDLTVPVGTTKIIPKTFSITKDTTIDVILSGEVEQSHHRTIQFGESAEITINPEAIYPEGSVVIPYTVENTGSLDTQFDLNFTLDSKTETRSIFVQVGGIFSDTLNYDLTTGDYTLSYDSFLGSGSVSFKVARFNQLEMTLSADISSTPSVLILKDDATEGDFNAVLMGAGMNVTVANVDEYQWDGTNPSPSDFDVVILLDGLEPSFGNNMPVSGQTALVDYVNAGGGLIITEWTTRENHDFNYYANMTDLLLFDPNQWDYNEGTGTFTVAQEHPVTAGLPASFAAPSHAGNRGGVKPEVSVLVTGDVLNDVVAVKEHGEGRIVQFAIAGNYVGNPFISAAEMQTLLINAATWAAGAKENELVVTVSVNNLGYNDFTGQLKIDSDFYSDISDLALNVGEMKRFRYNFNLVDVKPEVYDVVASALYEGNVIQQVSTTIEVPGAEFELTSKPDNPIYIPGEEATMSFKVKNTGKAEGEAEVNLKIIDLLDETRMVWIMPGVEEEINFTFVIWDDLPEKTYKAEFQLNGVTTEIPFTVKGVKIAVAASLDKPIYNLGETAVLTLDITNEGDLYPEMYARMQPDDYEEIQDFTLSDSNTLQFNIPIDESTQEYISYGIYLASGRAVYLNTIYIRLSGDILSLYTDKGVYMQGELVTVFVETSHSGTLSVTGPGLAEDIEITGSTSFDFVLPNDMASGTYSIDWIFGESSGVYNFDVLGYSARILECTLDKETYNPIDEMRITFRIEVNQEFPGILRGWLLDPTGNYSDFFELSKPLAAGENQIQVSAALSTPYSDIHRVVYALYKNSPELLLASGAESFDVRAIAMTALSTLKPTYESDESVQAKANAFASETFSGDIQLSVDGIEITEESVSFNGYQEFTYDLGIFDLGKHAVSAKLLSDSAVISQQDASFTVIDTKPPASPTGLSASVEGSTATLIWNANPESDLRGYHVYRNGPRFTTISIAETTYRDSSLVANTDYTYYITAVDKVGNESDPSNSVTLGVDSIPPVITFSPASDITSDEPVTMTYSVTDNVDPVPTVDANYPSPTTFNESGVHTVNVSAEDSAGNTSSKSVTITIERESQPPTPITILKATDVRIGGTVDLDWTGYDEAGQDVVSYNVYQSEADFSDVTGVTKIATVEAGTFSYQVTGLTDGTMYYFAVTAVDVAGNEDTSVTTASAVPSAVGSLAIMSEPEGAAVYLNGNYAYLGEYQGVTPITLPELPAGKYVVRLALAGYDTSYSLAEVTGGDTTELSVALVESVIPQYITGDTIKNISGEPLHPSGVAVASLVVDWNMDGKKDILISNAAGEVHYYQNIGTDDAPAFDSGVTLFSGLGTNIGLFVVDWNNDGKKDLLTGDGAGNVTLYFNTGTGDEPGFDNGTVVVNVDSFAIPCVVDWNNDHKKDIIVGDGNGNLNLFFNHGDDRTPVIVGTPWPGDDPPPSVDGHAAPCVLDWNADGKKDLLVGCETGELYRYLNSGTDATPNFTTSAAIIAGDAHLSVGENSIPFVVDWNNDNLKDLVIGNKDGLVYLFLGAPNQPPVVNPIGDDVTIDEGSTFTSSGSFTDPGDDSWTATVDYGDGTEVQPLTLNPDKTFTLNHLYADNGTYTATVTVTDDDEVEGSNTAIVTVNNVAPTVNAGEDVPIYEGSDFMRSGSFTDPGEDTWTATVDYGDGTEVQPLTLNPDKTFNLNHMYLDNGIYTVRVTVTETDPEAASGFYEFTMTVNNVPPTVDAGDDATINEGSSFTSSGSFTDPGADTWTATVDYGDSTEIQPLTLNPDKSFALNHTYADNGVYIVTVTVTDEDAGVGSDTVTVTVNNVVPVVDAGSDQTVNEGDEVNINATFTDAGTADTHDNAGTTIDWGDGIVESGTVAESNGSGTVAGSHVYADNGIYTVRVTVTDDDHDTVGNGQAFDELTVTVNNVAPMVEAGEDASIDEGGIFTGSGSFVDPGVDTWTATVDYGDDTEVLPLTLADKTFNLNHVYADNGTYIVTVTVTDDDGGVGSDTATVTVNNVAPTAVVADNQTTNEGTELTLDVATFSDLGLDEHTAQINWGDGTTEAGTVTQTVAGGPGTPREGVVSGSHIYLDDGIFTVMVTVADDDGGSDTVSFSVTVNNVAPTAVAAEAQITDEGTEVTLDVATFSEPGMDSHTAQIDWGDGTIEAGTVTQTVAGGAGTPREGIVSGAHIYLDDGIFTVTVTVTDDDGGSDTVSFSVTVNNVAPSAVAADEQITDEGTEVTLDVATFSDPGMDSHTAQIDWGDGTQEAGTVTQTVAGGPGIPREGVVSRTHIYLNDGIFTITVTVTDDDGDLDTVNFLFAVRNVPPIIVLNTPEGGEIIQGDFDITWTVTDVVADSITVDVLFRLGDDGPTFTIAKGVENLTALEFPDALSADGVFSWDTTTAARDRSDYRIIVIARDNLDPSAPAMSGAFTVDNEPLKITPVPPEPKIFNPILGEKTRLCYNLSEPASVTEISIFEAKKDGKLEEKKLTKTIGVNSKEQPGVNGHEWDGVDDAGKILKDDQYLARITATDFAGKVVTADGSPEHLISIEKHLPVIELDEATPNVFTPASGETTTISYRLFVDVEPKKDGKSDEKTQLQVDIRLFDASGNLVNLLFSGIEEGSSVGNSFSHTWDGTDTDGVIVLPGVYTFEVTAVKVKNEGPEEAQVANAQRGTLIVTAPDAILTRDSEGKLRLRSTPPLATLTIQEHPIIDSPASRTLLDIGSTVIRVDEITSDPLDPVDVPVSMEVDYDVPLCGYFLTLFWFNPEKEFWDAVNNEAVERQTNRFVAEIDNFGLYALLSHPDNTPPEIADLQVFADMLSFTITDDFSGVDLDFLFIVLDGQQVTDASFTGADGDLQVVVNKPLTIDPTMEHLLLLECRDVAGNSTEQGATFRSGFVKVLVRVEPEALNDSKGKMTAFAQFPEGIEVQQIFEATLDGAVAEKIKLKKEGTEAEFKFSVPDILAVQGELLDTHFVLRGSFDDGTAPVDSPYTFEGTDSIKKVVVDVAGKDDLCAGHVKPLVLTMKYTGEGEDALYHSQDPKKVSVVGNPNFASPVYIIANDKADPNDSKAKVWFDGIVTLNSTFDINAANGGEKHLKADTYVHIFDESGTVLLQSIKFHTSCSQPLSLGDQFGSLVLVGFIPAPE